ncbi:hypothetical protein [Sporisorium scitamineum]|uniref:Uncharacterized protein n=1 Tax=Sporisorium scitamineum TaxID=49012 RepID=A0A0F7RWX7_9BASI|nr:hypothetical protein [Sporisorium scitamineum]
MEVLHWYEICHMLQINNGYTGNTSRRYSSASTTSICRSSSSLGRSNTIFAQHQD